MFVLLRGRSRKEAFRIGEEIARAVTETNPDPVKLKFEKVFHPCVLQSKKRYVGYAFEDSSQQHPVFDAKGIETVRRDTCPIVSKILEKCLRILFENNEKINLVKNYLSVQFSKICGGRLPLNDFVFAKEYRGRFGYHPDALVPALKIARERRARDKRSEPRMKERVPYVIVCGPPESTLISCVREPPDLFRHLGLRLNFSYYIKGQIMPALNRIFLLMGEDVRKWYAEMPRLSDSTAPLGDLRSLETWDPNAALTGRRGRAQRTLSQFFRTSFCPSCGELTLMDLCIQCRDDPVTTLINLQDRIRIVQKRWSYANLICKACVGSTNYAENVNRSVGCESLECPLYSKRYSFERDYKRIDSVKKLISEELLQNV